MTACSIDGCGKPPVARGWCHAHYKKWQLHGSPTHGTTYARAHGDGTVTTAGYVALQQDGKKRQQHIVVAERAPGRPLPAGAIVHHVDNNGQNNAPTNLVVCPSQSYHRLIHMREKARDACGNPDYRQCVHCRGWDHPSAMTCTGNSATGHRHYHKPCRSKAERERKAK